MKVVTPGHKYVLEGYGVSSGVNQTVTFIVKSSDSQFLTGTTNEEVLSMLLDRLTHQQSINHSEDTMEALTYLKQAKRVLARRADKKVKRKFDETSKKKSEHPTGQAQFHQWINGVDPTRA
jgi:hypothetical protein